MSYMTCVNNILLVLILTYIRKINVDIMVTLNLNTFYYF